MIDLTFKRKADDGTMEVFHVIGRTITKFKMELINKNHIKDLPNYNVDWLTTTEMQQYLVKDKGLIKWLDKDEDNFLILKFDKYHMYYPKTITSNWKEWE